MKLTLYFQYISILASIRFYIMMMIFAYMMLTLRGLVQIIFRDDPRSYYVWTNFRAVMSQKKFLQAQQFNQSIQLFGLNIAIGLYFLLSFIIFVFLFGHVVALERSRWPFYNDEIDELVGVSVAGVINIENMSEKSINRNCLQYEFTNRTNQGTETQ